MKSGSRGTGKDTENWSFSQMVVDGLQESIGSIINWGQFYFKIKHEESQSSSCYPWQRELVSGQISELFVLCAFYGKEKEGGGGGEVIHPKLQQFYCS